MPKIPGKHNGRKVEDIRLARLPQQLQQWYTTEQLWDQITCCQVGVHRQLKCCTVSVKLTKGRAHYWLADDVGAWRLNRTTATPGPYNLITP